MSGLFEEWERLWGEYAEANRGDVMQVNWVGTIARDAFKAGYEAGCEAGIESTRHSYPEMGEDE